MNHFDEAAWTDFVRGLASPEGRTAMERHLQQDNCQVCQTTVEFLRGIREIASVNRLTTPPDQLSVSVKALFVSRETGGRLAAALRRIAGVLTFDSFVELQPAGARTVRASARQLMYEAEEYCVDLRAEISPDTPEMTLTGQIASSRRMLERMNELTVTVAANRRVMKSTKSNDLGEFCLKFVPRPHMKLSIDVIPDGEQVEISLSPLFQGKRK